MSVFVRLVRRCVYATISDAADNLVTSTSLASVSGTIAPSQTSRSSTANNGSCTQTVTSMRTKSSRRNHGYGRTPRCAAAAATGGLLAVGIGVYIKERHCQCAEADDDDENETGGHVQPGLRREDLPDFRTAEIQRHIGITSQGNGSIWVRYGQGVYDVTTFVKDHPGGDRIMLAAGGQMEPFWRIYAIHHTPYVYEILEGLRIGNVHPDDVSTESRAVDVDESDPFAREPERNPVLRVNSARPYNAEPPAPLLLDNFYTPADLFFVRNHLPVPDIDVEYYCLSVAVEGTGGCTQFTREQLYEEFRVHTISSAIQCAGNRRSGMSRKMAVKGLSWNKGAISNAQWTGVKLADVLHSVGVREGDGNAHVILQGSDRDMLGVPYEVSIPIETALDPRRDVLLAFEMNGHELTRDHGYPCRVIVPGTIGARQVKWVKKIIASKTASKSHWQQNDYKVLSSPDSGAKAVAIQEYPVQSVICEPAEGANLISTDDVTIKGYACSGGGRGIISVDVSIDNGTTWHQAELQSADQSPHRQWAWTLFEIQLEIPQEQRGKPLEIVCKATDTSHNCQPESTDGIWNGRGLLNNSWHRVKVQIPSE